MEQEVYNKLFSIALEFVDEQSKAKDKSSEENLSIPTEQRRDFLNGLAHITFDGMITHLPKFTHPSSKAKGINCLMSHPQGHEKVKFLFSSYSPKVLDYDICSNAANMKLIKFLTKEDSQGNSFMKLLALSDSEPLNIFLQDYIGFSSDDCLSIIGKLNEQLSTSDEFKLANLDYSKQVYFPFYTVDGQVEYKNIVLYSASSLHVYLTKKVSEKIKLLKENALDKNLSTDAVMSEEKLSVSYLEKHLGVMKFGGTKPQNISMLNNEMHGELTLLSCCPKNEFVCNKSVVSNLSSFEKRSYYFLKSNDFLRKLYIRLQHVYKRPGAASQQLLNDTVVKVLSSYIDYCRSLDFTFKFRRALSVEDDFMGFYLLILNEDLGDADKKRVAKYLLNMLRTNISQQKLISDEQEDYLLKSIKVFLKTLEVTNNE